MFGENKKWEDRNVKPKPCKECGLIFNPFCGGSKFCLDCTEKVKASRRKQHADYERARRAKDPIRQYKIKADWDLRTKYGIDYDTYLEMEESQGKACAICGDKDPNGRGVLRKFAVDHCHTTGKVRGLLCAYCNTALGLFKENTDVMMLAIEYLKEHNERPSEPPTTLHEQPCKMQ